MLLRRRVRVRGEDHPPPGCRHPRLSAFFSARLPWTAIFPVSSFATLCDRENTTNLLFCEYYDNDPFFLFLVHHRRNLFTSRFGFPLTYSNGCAFYDGLGSSSFFSLLFPDWGNMYEHSFFHSWLMIYRQAYLVSTEHPVTTPRPDVQNVPMHAPCRFYYYLCQSMNSHGPRARKINTALLLCLLSDVLIGWFHTEWLWNNYQESHLHETLFGYDAPNYHLHSYSSLRQR